MRDAFLNVESAHPMRFADGRENPCIAHLARVIDHPNIKVGNFTYANDFDRPTDWAARLARLAPYTYAGAPETLHIGRFCQIAHGVRFITASANHSVGLSTYPFPIFDPTKLDHYKHSFNDLPDTVIGHDCWIGHGAIVLPGARLGHGVIVGAGAVVGGVVPDYAIVVGNPARLLRMRFDAGGVAKMLGLAWWHWPLDQIEAALPQIMGSDVEALVRAAK